MQTLRLTWFLAALILPAATSAESAQAQRHLLLAGGHLPVCTDDRPQQCQGGRFPGDVGQNLSVRYRLDQDGLRRAFGNGWLAHRQDLRRRSERVFRNWYGRVGAREFAAADLPLALPEADRAIWEQLADFERDRIFDALQVNVASVQVALAASANPATPAIYDELIAMARERSGRKRPRVLISTASSRDPFDAIDYYLQVFEQAGAQARWLPLDHALQAAQADAPEACDRLDQLRGRRLGAWDRSRVHPDRAAELAAACRDPAHLLRALDWADAVFLNGGDQSFTRAAWFTAQGAPSAALQLLLQRLESGELVLAGTSAGSAVQAHRPERGPRAMLISGAPVPSTRARALPRLPPRVDCARARACDGIDGDALLYHPGGGLGSFPFGVIDTHFSDRGRELRLARLVWDTGVDIALGIDEATAVRVDGDRAKVIGKGQVTVLERLGEGRLMRVRRAAGSQFSLTQSVAEAVACAESQVEALPEVELLQVAAGTSELAQALDVLPTKTPRTLQLRDGQSQISGGRLCKPDADTLIWDAP